MRLIQRGDRNAKVLIVGEAAGADEDRLGYAFVGMSGRELYQQLGLSGWNIRDLFMTNVCHDRPPSNEIEHFFAKKSVIRKSNTLFGLDLAAACVALGGEDMIVQLGGRYCRAPIIAGLLQLQRDIDRIRPTLIIALGNTPLWALTGLTGILKWRGSILEAKGGPIDGHGCKLIPTLHPAYVLREMAYRAIVISDLKRAKAQSAFPDVRLPQWNFTIPTSVGEVRDWLDAHVFSDAFDKLSNREPFIQVADSGTGRVLNAQRPIVADVENIIGDGSLICLGFASSPIDAICIPFMHRVGVGDDSHYWPDPADEAEVSLLCAKALKARPIVFHNGLHDCQIIAKQWGILPRFEHDTMVKQHVLYPGMLGGKIDPITGRVSKKGSSLSLSFCSSLHNADHRFWKDDGRDWDASINDEAAYWRYNCTDTVRTYQIDEEQTKKLVSNDLWEQYLFEMQLFKPVLETMFRGVRFADDKRKTMRKKVSADRVTLQCWLDEAIGHELNVGSSKQMMQLFYDDFGIPPVLHRKTRQRTLDDKALEKIIKTKPILHPIIERIQAIRSLGVFEENFLDVKLDGDGRLRGALNIAGPETMRFSSNIDAFGVGMNLQNLPRDD